MPRFLINTSIGTYWRYVVEAADATAARERAQRNFEDNLEYVEPTIHVVQVEDATPEGDA